MGLAQQLKAISESRGEVSPIADLVVDNLDIWTSAIRNKAGVGRGGGSKRELYGIKKLRELILELAVRGLLVPQDPNDEPASDLLDIVEATKNKLLKKGEIKKAEKAKPVSSDEISFKKPRGWELVRFKQVLDFSGGSQPPKSQFSDENREGCVQLIQIRDLGPHPQPVFVPKDSVSKFCTPDDVMIGRYGASVGKVFWGKAGAYNVALIKLHNDFGCYTKEFLFLLMSSPLGQSLFSGISRSAQAGFSKGDIEDNILPVPPKKEQHRIVAKVDELMSLCDQLEQQTEASLTAHETLVESLLGALTNAESHTSFQQAWQRIAQHFDTLFTTEHSIDQLKQTILQLAVMGKLVPQDPNDEPASELLKKIAAEKAELVKAGKIKKEKPLSPISDKETFFLLPKGWEWCRLNDLAVHSEAGWSPKCEESPRENDNWGVLKISAVTWGSFNCAENKALPDHLEARPEYEVNAGDFLISRANTAELVARSVVVQNNAPRKLMMSDKIIRFIFSKHVVTAYVNMFNNSSFSRGYYLRVAGGTSSSMKNVSRFQIQNLVVALPPAEEQLRIIVKVEELMVLCDRLKNDICEAQITQLHLAGNLSELVT